MATAVLIQIVAPQLEKKRPEATLYPSKPAERAMEFEPAAGVERSPAVVKFSVRVRARPRRV